MIKAFLNSSDILCFCHYLLTTHSHATDFKMAIFDPYFVKFLQRDALSTYNNGNGNRSYYVFNMSLKLACAFECVSNEFT